MIRPSVRRLLRSPRLWVWVPLRFKPPRWGALTSFRQVSKLGQTVRLMPPSYVKGYVKRSKNDAADAAAVCEAVTRPSMRFVPIKSADQQALLMLHRTRDLLIRQRTQLINALRDHLSVYAAAVETRSESRRRATGISFLNSAPSAGMNLEILLSTAMPSCADNVFDWKSIRVVSCAEDMEIWNASSDGFSFVISYGPGFHQPPNYVTSWHSLSWNKGRYQDGRLAP